MLAGRPGGAYPARLTREEEMTRARNDWADRAVDAALRSALGAVGALPYAARVRAMGALAARVAAPLAGWPERIRANLALARPDLPEAEVRRLQRAVPDAVGRSLAELYSGEAFLSRVRGLPVEGPGGEAIEEARRDGRAIVAVTGHFGSYDAARAALMARGHRMGGLYKPLRNPHVNRHYAAAISAVAGPAFPRGREGLAALIRHLRGGGLLVILSDLYVHGAPELRFFGRPAPTALTAAELALRHDALLVPFYGVRRPGGLSFDLQVHAPVPHEDPAAMMQAVNDDLEAMVRAHMDQWFWIHRRWKPERRLRA